MQNHRLIVRPENSQKAYVTGNCNFGFLFLATSGTFLRTNLIDPDLGWTVSEIEDFIEKEELEIIPYLKGKDELMNKYFTVATEIRRRFFNEYSELVVWSDTYKKFVHDNGYIRSLFGTFRRLPYLQYIGNDSDKKKISNYESIAVNSPTQSLEVGVVTRACIEVNNYLKANKFHSFSFMLIHDAIEFMIYKPERDIVVPKIIEFMNKEYPEMAGLPQSIEAGEEDYYESKGLHLFDFEAKEGSNDWWDKYNDIVMKYADNPFTPVYLK